MDGMARSLDVRSAPLSPTMRQPKLSRRRTAGVVSAALLLCLAPCDAFVAQRLEAGVPVAGRAFHGRAHGVWEVVPTSNQRPLCRRDGGGFLRLGNTVLRASDDENGDHGSGGTDGGERKESRFGVRSRVKSVLRLRASRGEGENDKGRVGVRSRVKSVLKKARARTGIRNNTEGGNEYPYVNGNVSGRTQPKPLKTISSATAVVAEAASIGGLGAVVVDEVEGKVDVALDYHPRPELKNGDADIQNYKQSASAPAVPPELNGAIESSSPNLTAIAIETPKTPPTPTTGTTQKTKKVAPASKYSPPIAPPPEPNPEDSLVPATSPKGKEGFSEMDAFKGDVSAAFSMPPEPLPFTLPDLTPEQEQQVRAGERVQFQADMGREGDGFVVWDVKASEDVIWDVLLDFHSYPDNISTVRSMTMYTNTHLKDDYRHEKPIAYEDGSYAMLKRGVPSVTRASFMLSKFRLKIAAIHKYRPHPQGDYMVFTLDPACTNMVLKSAKGVWHTQCNPDGKGKEYTRVWLLCELKVSSLLPQFITDYAAKRAMPRATTWLKPKVEGVANQQ